MGVAFNLFKYTDLFLNEVVIFKWVAGKRQRSKTTQRRRNENNIGV